MNSELIKKLESASEGSLPSPEMLAEMREVLVEAMKYKKVGWLKVALGEALFEYADHLIPMIDALLKALETGGET